MKAKQNIDFSRRTQDHHWEAIKKKTIDSIFISFAFPSKNASIYFEVMCAIYWNNIENYNDNKNQNYLILSVVAWDRSICCAQELAFSIEIINRRIQKETKPPNKKGDHLISLLCFIIIDIGY